ncbi:hypothetical protein [Rhizobium sp. BR 362]|uniref:hypothetical protein n=1 Tax=Rhizobium sp. BR 362 TaxID=3040670 RepID=UPI000AE9BFA7
MAGAILKHLVADEDLLGSLQHEADNRVVDRQPGSDGRSKVLTLTRGIFGWGLPAWRKTMALSWARSVMGPSALVSLQTSSDQQDQAMKR